MVRRLHPLKRDDQDQGPAENYAAFKVAFKQHYGIGGATNNLCWADTFCQRSDEDIREYFSRSTAEMGNHLPLLYGKTYTPVDITINGNNTLKRVQRPSCKGPRRTGQGRTRPNRWTSGEIRCTPTGR
jgi:hypothetical protein